MYFLNVHADGEKGVGKSITMAHLLHYAHEQGYLIVHIPWGKFYSYIIISNRDIKLLLHLYLSVFVNLELQLQPAIALANY